MWRCPKCKRQFANTHQSHACGRHSLHAHFDGKSPHIRAIYDAFVAALSAIGPVTILPERLESLSRCGCRLPSSRRGATGSMGMSCSRGV
jgi:hypothetical protein